MDNLQPSILNDFGFAQRHKVLVEKLENGKATIVHCPNVDVFALLELRRFLDCPLAFRQISETEFADTLSQHFESAQNDTTQIAQNIEDNLDLSLVLNEMPDDEDLLDSQEDAPIIKLLNALLSESIKMNASDIHFETFQNEFVVRFRIDGVLHEIFKPPKNLSALLVSRIKVMAKLDIAEKKTPQDGRISLKIAGRNIDVRVSILPSNHGERAVLRILDKKQSRLEMIELGARSEVLEIIDKVIHKPHGIILVTGPTGSGKTTTLYAAINKLNSVSRNILTVEDPIEYDLQGIGQTQVNPKVGMTFAKGLRAILRQDPDVIMVGEIRDKETADIAIEASLTGHLVLSTLHTNSAIGAIVRLQDMGVQPFLLSSSLVCVMAQRLVRKSCEHCKESYRAPPSECLAMNQPKRSKITLYRPKGCNECNQFGYKGRTGIYEIIVIDETLKKMIHDQDSEQTMREYARNYSKDLLHDGVERVMSGETSLEEVLRVTNTSSVSGGEQ